MRAYALEKLSESGEIEQVRALHAAYYRDLFERAETEWETRPTAEWLAPNRQFARGARLGVFAGR